MRGIETRVQRGLDPQMLHPHQLCTAVAGRLHTVLQVEGPPGLGYMGLAATTWAPMGAQVPVLSPNDHPKPSQGRQNGFGKSQILKNSQVPLNNINNRNFGGFGGPIARATWA